MLKKSSAKSYIVSAIILALLVGSAIFKYYKLPRSKVIRNVKMETFSLEKQWEHIKKKASMNGDVRVDTFSLNSSYDNKKCNLLITLYEKKKSGPLQETFLFSLSDSSNITNSSPLGNMIKITIFPQSRYSINTEEYMSMDDFSKIFDKIQENINTIFKTPVKEYSLELIPKMRDYNKINSAHDNTYYIDKKKNTIRPLKKEDLPLHNTVSIICDKSIDHPLEETAEIVVGNIR